MQVSRAYPRGRGGARRSLCIFENLGGLSPRTRGSPAEVRQGTAFTGPIPADAGEPRQGLGQRVVDRAYPRGRGGARSAVASRADAQGLSPRTRGSLGAVRGSAGGRGPIPADAGEPVTTTANTSTRKAYPRGRGGAAPS